MYMVARTAHFLTFLFLTSSYAAANDLPAPANTSASGEPKIEAKHEESYNETQPDQPAAVYSKPCPFDCNGEGFSHQACREWKQDNMCFIGPKESNKK